MLIARAAYCTGERAGRDHFPSTRLRTARVIHDEAHEVAAQRAAVDVTVSLQTKKIKDLHENDFIIAAKLDRIADGLDSARC